MVSATKIFTFCAAHRLVNHQGLCRYLHGHNYKVEVGFRCSNDDLDPLGMVLDFSDIKSTVGLWLAENWDHAIILNKDDAPALAAVKLFEGMEGAPARLYRFPGNPTAERMAYEILLKCAELMPAGSPPADSVTVWETDSSFATAVA